MNPECSDYQHSLKSAQWLQTAPIGCTFGVDVIATLGWRRQAEHLIFTDIHADLKTQISISESQVRHLYYNQYLPLLACNERKELDRLKQVSTESGLLLSLDGLAPEGGEAQLWTVRELRTGLTVRCGWMSGQDQVSFENVLTPIVDSGFRVTEILSDKQRGLLPAIKAVFPDAKHALCQAHYLKNIAEPVAEKDEAMKLELRKAVRASVGTLIRSEHVEKPGVLTVTGLLPSSTEASVENCTPDMIQSTSDKQTDERDIVVESIQQRVRYLLTLKGRPPFRLAGVEMYERLSEVDSCLSAMLKAHEDVRLKELHVGVSLALQGVTDTYIELRQAADWLFEISDILEPEDKPMRTGEQVRQELQTHIEAIVQQSEDNLHLSKITSKI